MPDNKATQEPLDPDADDRDAEVDEPDRRGRRVGQRLADHAPPAREVAAGQQRRVPAHERDGHREH